MALGFGLLSWHEKCPPAQIAYMLIYGNSIDLLMHFHSIVRLKEKAYQTLLN